eukprot:COSAG06_NODE_404_length_16134_cov_88.503336_8_plen_185_part_00
MPCEVRASRVMYSWSVQALLLAAATASALGSVSARAGLEGVVIMTVCAESMRLAGTLSVLSSLLSSVLRVGCHRPLPSVQARLHRGVCRVGRRVALPDNAFPNQAPDLPLLCLQFLAFGRTPLDGADANDRTRPIAGCAVASTGRMMVRWTRGTGGGDRDATGEWCSTRKIRLGCLRVPVSPRL